MADDTGGTDGTDGTDGADGREGIQRDAAGRFLPGTKGGPGRAPVDTNEHKQALVDAITPDEIKRVVRKLLDLALDGDVQAAKILLDRLFGKVAIFPDDDDAPMMLQPIVIPVHGPGDPIARGYQGDDGDDDDRN